MYGKQAKVNREGGTGGTFSEGPWVEHLRSLGSSSELSWVGGNGWALIFSCGSIIGHGTRLLVPWSYEMWSHWGSEHDIGEVTLLAKIVPWGVHQLTCHLNWHPLKGYRLCFLFLSDCFQDFVCVCVFSSQKSSYDVSLRDFGFILFGIHSWIYWFIFFIKSVTFSVVPSLDNPLTHPLPFQALRSAVPSHGFLEVKAHFRRLCSYLNL